MFKTIKILNYYNVFSKKVTSLKIIKDYYDSGKL